MRPRYPRRSLGVLSIAFVLGACTNGGDATKAPTAASNGERRAEMLVLNTASGVEALDTATGSVLFERTGAAAMPDWSRVFSTAPVGDATQLREIDPGTGTVASSVRIGGHFVVRVVSGDGHAVALVPSPDEADTWTPVDRSSTTIVVAHPAASDSQAASRQFRLRGNFMPEAFSTDDQDLFMIEYLPAVDPVSYRVVRLRLDEGKVEALYGRTKGASPPERMSGSRLQQVRAPDGAQLYTLYTNQPSGYAKEYSSQAHDDGRPLAFIHTLNLRDGWAYCLDLPRAFGPGPAASKAVALSPDGSRLYAIDAARGLVAVMNTESLKVIRTERADFRLAGGQTFVNLGSDGRTLYVARGSQLVAVDTKSFATIDRWSLPAVATGLAASTDGTRLYATTSDSLQVLDPATGHQVRSFPVSGVNGIDYIGAPSFG